MIDFAGFQNFRSGSQGKDRQQQTSRQFLCTTRGRPFSCGREMAIFTRRRRPRPLAWALLSLLIAVSLGPDLAAADVMPPTGLVVKRSMSLDGAEATVEWCSPRCVDSVDVLYSFKVFVYDATTSELVSTAETNTGQNGLKCQLDWHARSPAQHRITGLTAYRDYVVRVQSRVHGEQNGPLSDLIESPEIVLRAGVTPRGSGREQVERSGLQTSIRRTSVYYSSYPSSSVDGMGLFPTEELRSQWGGMRHVGSIAFDPDGDGDLDLFIIAGDTCQYSTNGNTCSEYPNVFLENNGSGWFHVHGHFETDEPHPLPDTRYDSRAAVAGDFNGDGFLDLFVANYDDVNELLLNDGTTGKQFVPSTNAGDAVTTTEKSMGVVAGDFDLDGDLDLFVVNYDSKNELFWNDGAGSFTLDDNPDSPLTNAVTYSWTVIAADFNGDGYLDIFEVCSTSFSSSMPNHDTTNRLYMSDGSGGFILSSDPEAMGPDDVETRGAVARDFNNDGIIDLYYVNKFQSDTNKLLINDGSGSFTAVGGIDATAKLSSSTSVNLVCVCVSCIRANAKPLFWS